MDCVLGGLHCILTDNSAVFLLLNQPRGIKLHMLLYLVLNRPKTPKILIFVFILRTISMLLHYIGIKKTFLKCLGALETFRIFDDCFKFSVAEKYVKDLLDTCILTENNKITAIIKLINNMESLKLILMEKLKNIIIVGVPFYILLLSHFLKLLLLS